MGSKDAFAWLDANAYVLTTRDQRIEGLMEAFSVSKSTAVVYISQWRKSHKVQRPYIRSRKDTTNN